LLSGDGEAHVVVKAQPFGGAVRLLNYTRLQSVVERFHFDSQRSRSEEDFRIYIRPSDWEAVREFCLHNLTNEVDSELESDPARELVEEFEDTMRIELRPDQYCVKPVGTVLENEPEPTRNIHASGVATVRIYRVFEAQIVDPALCRAMVANSRKHSSHDIRRLALDDARKGGKGRANAMLVATIQSIRDAYLAVPPEKRSARLPFKDTHLDGNVPAVLEGIFVPKYQHLSG
jgi:hypothetical protein